MKRIIVTNRDARKSERRRGDKIRRKELAVMKAKIENLEGFISTAEASGADTVTVKAVKTLLKIN